MRLHLKKAIKWTVAICVLIALSVHLRLSSLVTKSENTDALPFQESRQRRPLKYAGELIHEHVKLQQNASVVTVDAGKSGVPETTLKVDKQISSSRLWYDPKFDWDDRIVSQMHHVPVAYKKAMDSGNPPKMKTILKHSGFGGNAYPGQKSFLESKCLVNRCLLTTDRKMQNKADAVIFNGGRAPARSPAEFPMQQVWLWYQLECPLHSSPPTGVYNWTATYRRDATIVAPYEKFVLYNSSVTTKEQNKNYAVGKTKKVAWFVSHCSTPNRREKYVHELAQYIGVDIYGACGTHRCSRSKSAECFKMLSTDYKFYIAFENSNCKDYITEKYFLNGLQNDIVPIVMGASPEEYKRSSPVHSFIHVEDFSGPQKLAEYLHNLDKNDDLYNEYFQWKGTGHFIDTIFWCRLCTMLHELDSEPHNTWYDNTETWWSGKGVCIGTSRWSDNKS